MNGKRGEPKRGGKELGQPRILTVLDVEAVTLPVFTHY